MVLASFNKIQLPSNATGPEALAFQLETGQFYTGIADGRILKYQGRTAGFVDFGFAAPNRLILLHIKQNQSYFFFLLYTN